MFKSAQSLSEYGTPFSPILNYHIQSSFKDVTISLDMMLLRIFSSKMYFERYCCLPSTKGVSLMMPPLYLNLFHERIIVNIGVDFLKNICGIIPKLRLHSEFHTGASMEDRCRIYLLLSMTKESRN